MDFNRGNRPVQQNTQAPEGIGSAVKPGAQKPAGSRSSRFKDSSKLLKIAYVAFLTAIAILVLAVVFSLVFAKDNKSNEAANIKKDKLQAVFLNGGQVYFGKITDLNSRYLSLSNIYYLRVNQQVQPDQANNASANDISLVKLGCELHGPEDSMVINREQVIFYENLKSDGQVAKAVDEYVKANPDGQKCDQQQTTSPSGNNGNNSAAPAANTPRPATGNNNAAPANNR